MLNQNALQDNELNVTRCAELNRSRQSLRNNLNFKELLWNLYTQSRKEGYSERNRLRQF